MTIRTVTGIAAALALGLLASPAQAGGMLDRHYDGYDGRDYGYSYKGGHAPYYSRGARVRVYEAPDYYVPSRGYSSYYRYDHGGHCGYAYTYTYPACCCCR